MQTPQLFRRPSGPQSRLQWHARLVRARDEVSKWSIVTAGANVWQVTTRPGHIYTVRWDGGWSCTCPDYCNAFLGDCKHTLGVQLLIQSQAGQSQSQSQSVQSDQFQSQSVQSDQSQSQSDQSDQSQSVNQIQTEVSEMEDEKILEQLSFPFPAKALQWRVGPCNRDKTRGVALAYVDSRDYIERLNAVLGLGWEDAYTFTVVGTRIVCKCELRLHLGERSIVRTGDGDCELEDPNATTVASAQAFKRACVKFGLGAYLYALPLEWVALEGDKNIPPEVQISLAAAYKRWLETGEWIFTRGQRAPSTKSVPAPVAASAPSTAPMAASSTAPMAASSTAPVAASSTKPVAAPSTKPVVGPALVVAVPALVEDDAPAPSTKPVAASAPLTAPVAASAPSTKSVAASAPSTRPVAATKSVPAPVAAANALGPGTFLVTRGEYRGQCIAQIYAQNPEYVQRLAESDFQPLRMAAQTFLAMQ